MTEHKDHKNTKKVFCVFFLEFELRRIKCIWGNRLNILRHLWIWWHKEAIKWTSTKIDDNGIGNQLNKLSTFQGKTYAENSFEKISVSIPGEYWILTILKK